MQETRPRFPDRSAHRPRHFVLPDLALPVRRHFDRLRPVHGVHRDDHFAGKRSHRQRQDDRQEGSCHRQSLERYGGQLDPDGSRFVCSRDLAFRHRNYRKQILCRKSRTRDHRWIGRIQSLHHHWNLHCRHSRSELHC